ncbi:MAG: DUF4097 domain-containing protein [Clostridiaceae bacterium]|nr:DUF4097 domain-containing protein [Clostridiaceae bacterium]
MKERGANIMPVIGFIIMILILFSGFMVYNNANADKGTGAGIISSTGSETEKRTGFLKYIVDDTDELSTYGKDLISINTSSVDVNIYTHAGNSVKAHLHGEVGAMSKEAVPYLEMEEDGKAVIVKVMQNQVFQFRYSQDVQLDVFIPELWMNDLNISTASGEITAQELSCGNIVIGSSSGDISIENVTGKNIEAETASGEIVMDAINGEDGSFKSSSGTFRAREAVFSGKFELSDASGECFIEKLECSEAKIETTSGDIVIKETVAENVKAAAASGNIILKMRTGSLEAKTSSGNIKAEFEDDFSMIRAESGSGNVDLTLPENSQFSVEAKTFSGRIKCSHTPLNIASFDEKRLVCTIGDGSGKVTINTTSGNILIR